MRDSVPSGSYSSVCNVLRQWKSRSSLLVESTDSMIEFAFCVDSENLIGLKSSDSSKYSLWFLGLKGDISHLPCAISVSIT